MRDGVGVRVSTSTSVRISLNCSWVTPALFVDDEQAEVLELHVRLEQAVRADDDIDLPSARSWMIWRCSAGLRNRESISTRMGSAAGCAKLL